MSVRALILGATGETGKEVLKELINADAVTKVVVVGRRQVESITDPKVEQRVIDFDNINNHGDAFQEVDVAYCCLGTTRGKAGKQGFIKVDHDYVLESASRLKEAGCKDFHLVSSTGASANSYFLYPQIKGKVEEAVKGMGFNRVSVYRPGLLMCDREENRTGEKFMRWAASWVDRGSRYSISTELLGRAIVKNSLKSIEAKAETLEHVQILNLTK